MSSYILITAARNEEAHIEKTIQSVVSQTILPRKWVIVSDGSTDRTDEIVQKYACEHNFIRLVRSQNDANRNFGSKAKAVQHGYSLVKDLTFNFVGNLDADVSFAPDYYRHMINQLIENPRLGIVGGVRFDLCNDKFRRIECAQNSVGGPFQFFRRECFEDVGGYQTMPFGGIDAVAEITARMKGWEVRSFPEYKIYHHRGTGAATFSRVGFNFNYGIKNYLIGYHPLFFCAQSMFHGARNKNIVHPFLRIAGYCWAFLRGHKRTVSGEFVRYLRAEQRTRLKSMITTGKDQTKGFFHEQQIDHQSS